MSEIHEIFDVWIRGRHPYAVRRGEWCRVIGMSYVAMVGDLYPRLCYHVKYADGEKDLWPVHDEHADYQLNWGPNEP